MQDPTRIVAPDLPESFDCGSWLDPDQLADVVAELADRARSWAARLFIDPGRRSAFRLMATDDYDVWLLTWPPGSRVTPHDHGASAGAFSVIRGRVVELRGFGRVCLARSVQPGEVVTFDQGLVHDVVGGAEPSASLHVYSPPLAAMSYYDDSGGVIARIAMQEAS